MFRFSLVTSAIAVGTYAAISAPEASPVRNEALRVLSTFAPQYACRLDAVACLDRRGDELRGIGNRIADVILNLIEQRNKVAVELNAAEVRLTANGLFLPAGRDLWERCGKFGVTVRWRGVTYTPSELKAQLQLLWDEKPLLEATVSGLRNASGVVDTRIGELAALRTKVAGETALMASRIASARAGVLVGDLDRVLADVDRIAAAADGEVAQAAIPTLRTTEELNASGQRPEPQARPHNPGFDAWLGGGNGSQ
jgi:hypothetical protein